MSNIIEYKDIVAFHPGSYIEEMIEEMGMNQAEFAKRMNTSTKTLSCLINGQANISNDLAKKLSNMTGLSVELWLNLQKEYNEKIIEIEREKDFEQQEILLKLIDYSYFVKVAGLPTTRNSREKILNLCKYLKVADLRVLKEPDFLVNYRTSISKVEEKNIINSHAWLQTAINFSKEIPTKQYDARKLKTYLPEFKKMTLKSPNEFLPRMKEIFAECGVAFVLLPHLKNSGVNGAVKWISDNRVVLAMNNRGLDTDQFWFSLFHEIKHILQKKIKKVFISGDVTSIDNELEKEADEFARNYLISEIEYEQFVSSGFKTLEDVLVFADKIQIHPGIVVGRLQHDQIIPMNMGNGLKEQYHFEDK